MDFASFTRKLAKWKRHLKWIAKNGAKAERYPTDNIRKDSFRVWLANNSYVSPMSFVFS